MDKQLAIRGKNIQLAITQHKIKLVNDLQLEALLAFDTESATEELVEAIRKAFQEQNNRDIHISDASMAVEIWGHVYTDNFANAIKSISLFDLFDSIAEKIIKHCEVIDIGEAGHDNNRFIWDRLASFKNMIVTLLPKKSS
jgi:hypothetical protein